MKFWLSLVWLLAQGGYIYPPFPSASTAVGHVHSITVNHTLVSSTVSGFPVYFGGIYAWLATVANGGQIINSTTCCANTETVPADLLFTSDSSCTVLLNWDIPYWDPVTGAIEVWIQDGLSSTVDTVIYACTGISATTTYQGNYTSTWDTGYKAVWHFGDGTTLDLHDSTTNANTCTNHGATVTTPLLATGGAANFVAASSQYMDCGSGLAISGPISGEAIIDVPSLPASGIFYTMLSNLDSALPTNGYHMHIRDPTCCLGNSFQGVLANSSAVSVTPSGSGGSVPTVNTPEFNAIVYGIGGTNQFTQFTNSVSCSGCDQFYSGALGASSHNLFIGSLAMLSNYYMNGVLDEIRISNVPRDQNWYKTQYQSMSSPGTFYAIVSIR